MHTINTPMPKVGSVVASDKELPAEGGESPSLGQEGPWRGDSNPLQWFLLRVPWTEEPRAHSPWGR